MLNISEVSAIYFLEQVETLLKTKEILFKEVGRYFMYLHFYMSKTVETWS